MTSNSLTTAGRREWVALAVLALTSLLLSLDVSVKGATAALRL